VRSMQRNDKTFAFQISTNATRPGSAYTAAAITPKEVFVVSASMDTRCRLTAPTAQVAYAYMCLEGNLVR